MAFRQTCRMLAKVPHIAQAIHKAVEIFCSPRREHPGMNPVLREPGPQDKADAAQAKQHILKRIEMVSADGASNAKLQRA